MANGRWVVLPPDINEGARLRESQERKSQRAHQYQDQGSRGLLQTEAYAWAYLRASNLLETEDHTAQLVDSRMRRQSLLTDADRPRLWAIITEAVITDLYGDPDILLGQIDRLLEFMEARIQLQIIPSSLRFREHPGKDGPFTILSLPDRQEVGYIEGVTSGNMITKPESVERYGWCRLAAGGCGKYAAMLLLWFSGGTRYGPERLLLR